MPRTTDPTETVKNARSLLLGLALATGGSCLAHWIQTDGGAVRVLDVRFVDARAMPMSGLLYVPRRARETPAPGVLAVHGYINSRETQSPFAIELARRGYVVLALDQTGHGFSAPPAFAAGFGGPAGLDYLRTLPFVDHDNIGLEGHSMGGWAVLSAAAAQPDGYRALVLEGSTTGVLGAPEGTTTFPRNLAVVFSIWDEFSALMWGVPRGADIPETSKLKAIFGTTDDVVEGRVYGNVADGTARILEMPATTHPGDHLSTAAVGAALDWFAQTLRGGESRSGQTWYWKELGTLAGLTGLVVSMIATGRLLLAAPIFQSIVTARMPSGGRRGLVALQLAVIPVLTYFPTFMAAERWLPANALWPQQITNGLMVWLLANAVLTGITLAVGWDARRLGLVWPDGFRTGHIVKALVLAVGIVGTGYALLAVIHGVLLVDFRFWVVAVKLLAPWHVPALLAYLPVLFAFFVLLGAAAVPLLDGASDVRVAARLASVLSGGFVVLLLIQYVPLLAGGSLPFGQPLLTIVAFQFVVLLAIVGAITAVFQRATGTVYTGACVNALFVGWVVVAGQATQVA